MQHTHRLRVALLTSLGFLPAACIGGRAADTTEDTQTHDIGRDRNTNTNTNTTLTSCDGTPVFALERSPFEAGFTPYPERIDSGLVKDCTGLIHRPSAVTCEPHLPRPMPPADAGAEQTQFEFIYRTPLERLSQIECTQDSDCTDRALGYCIESFVGGPEVVARCSYGCQSDADCGAGTLCECGDPAGRCMPTDCRTDADCGGDLKCGLWVGEVICESPPNIFACQTEQDTCVTAADCGAGTCEVKDGHRQCVPASGLVCGRPFLVQGEARLATLIASADWSGAVPTGALHLSAAERERAGKHWSDAALMEHASIAAFARFTLQLMHLGAPRALVEASQRAMLDETEHARLCFGLAQRYLEAPAGPGPLPLGDALLDIDLDSIVRMTFREGCIGETVAALEAHAARDGALDPDVQRGLERIATDELRHAELAWRFVSWALEQNPVAVRALLADELAAIERESTQPAAPIASGMAVPAHGVLTERERARVRRSALAEVVRPCVQALLDGTAPECSDAGQFRATPTHSFRASA